MYYCMGCELSGKGAIEMIKLLVTLGVMNLLAAMSPGPDFAVVTRNALRHSRKGGVLTALGISVAALIHIGYCSLGLTTLISQSLMVFIVIKCVGGLYLIYLGCAGLLSSSSAAMNKTAGFDPKAQPSLVKRQVFWQGFLTNALNPKAALFFLALFTAVVGNHRLGWLTIVVAMELFCVIFLWFSFFKLAHYAPSFVWSFYALSTHHCSSTKCFFDRVWCHVVFYSPSVNTDLKPGLKKDAGSAGADYNDINGFHGRSL